MPVDSEPVVNGSAWRLPRKVIVLTALLLFQLLSACGSGEKEPWRSAHLDEEFSLRGSPGVQSFSDYLALEERLFRQLDEQVYAVTDTGSGNEWLRFSNGGAADPRGWRPNWNRSFELQHPQPAGGVLLLHGMSDSPYSLRALAESLNQAGYQVLGLRLPGHGTAPSGLKHIRWEDMAAAVRIAMQHLADEVEGAPVHIFGYSAGATLAVNFALEALKDDAGLLPASLVLISPAIGISRAAAFAGWKNRLARLPGMSEKAWLVNEPEFDPYKYNSFATNAGQQTHLMTRSVAARLSRLAATEQRAAFPPTLVLKSNADATVSNAATVDGLLGLLEPQRNELVLFDINRLAAASVLQVYDPGLLTVQLAGDAGLPFSLTLVTNENADSLAVVARRKPPFSAGFQTNEALSMRWPAGVLSLSHVALPFPPDDPLYGQFAPPDKETIFLGQLAMQGERGLFALSTDWLLRIRHNPFYSYLEERAIDWVTSHQPARAEPDRQTAHQPNPQ